MSLPGIHRHGLNKTHLCSDGVTPSGEEFRDTCRVEASLCQAECCPQTGTSSTPERTHGEVSATPHDAAGREGGTHTTMASYSCSMSGYLPNDCGGEGSGQRERRSLWSLAAGANAGKGGTADAPGPPVP